MATLTLDQPAPAPAVARPAPAGRRLAAAALIAGAALNTAEAVVTGLVLGGRDRSPADEIATAAANRAGVLTVTVLGLASVPALLIGFQAMAHLVRGRLPRLGAAAAVLTFLGTLGFLGMQALGLARIIVLDDPGAAARLGEHPLGLLVVTPFLIGMFGGLALLTAGLFRVRGVPRWIPGAFALFWVLDLAVGGVGPVDPHWLFLAGSTGLAVAVLRAGDRGWAAARL